MTTMLPLAGTEAGCPQSLAVVSSVTGLLSLSLPPGTWEVVAATVGQVQTVVQVPDGRLAGLWGACNRMAFLDVTGAEGVSELLVQPGAAVKGCVCGVTLLCGGRGLLGGRCVPLGRRL